MIKTLLFFSSVLLFYASFFGCDELKIIGFRNMDGEYTRKFNSRTYFYDDKGLFVLKKKSCEWSVKEIGFEYPSYVSHNCGYSWRYKYNENIFDELSGLTISYTRKTVDLVITIILLLLMGFFIVGFLSSCV